MKTSKKSVVDFADQIKLRSLLRELSAVTTNPVVQDYCTRARVTVQLRGEVLVLNQKVFKDSASLIAFAQAELNGPLSWRELANKAARRKDVSAWVHFYKKAAMLLVLITTFSFGHRAFGQESSHCYNPTPNDTVVTTDVCELKPSGRVNVTTVTDGVAHSDWYTPEEWSKRGPELHKMWDSINTSQIDLLNKQAAEWHTLSISKNPKAKCEAAGGNWSSTRIHKCQLPK